VRCCSRSVVVVATKVQIQKSSKAIGGAVLAGGLVALAGAFGGETVGGVKVMFLCCLLAFGLNWLAFIPANAAQTEKYYDLTGSVTYLSVIVFALVAVGSFDGRSVLLTCLIAMWAVRLGSFLFARVRKDGKDGRFDKIKVNPLRFLTAWTTQGLWVFLTLSCALAAITAPSDGSVGVVAVVGAVVWLLGFGIEVTADNQKTAFKKDPANSGRFISTGIWAWSRHPNYFGEILLWTGVAIIALPTLSGWRWLTLVSPVFVYLLLTRASGVPLLETRADARWGGQQDYEAYKAATPVLMMRPPR